MSLNTIGMFFGTDKSSLRNNYLVHYQTFFCHWQYERFNLIEIGIHHGASLQMWQAYFEQATIIGIDIEPLCRRFSSGRIHVEIGSQDDESFLSAVATKFPPKCVIDDGSHMTEHQIFSFQLLFPLLQPAGCYVVEDVSPNPSSKYNGHSAISYFSAIQNQLMGQSPFTAEQSVARIDTFPRAVMVWKSPKIDYSVDLPWMEDLVRRSEKSESLLYFSEYLDYRVGSLERALEMAQRGADIAPNDPWLHVRIADILQKKGDLDGAIVAARKALRLGPDIPFIGQFFEQITSKKCD